MYFAPSELNGLRVAGYEDVNLVALDFASDVAHAVDTRVGAYAGDADSGAHRQQFGIGCDCEACDGDPAFRRNIF